MSKYRVEVKIRNMDREDDKGDAYLVFYTSPDNPLHHPFFSMYPQVFSEGTNEVEKSVAPQIFD